MNSVQTTNTSVVPAERLCPRCGAPLGGFGPEGLCGACLLGSALVAPEPAEPEAAPDPSLPRFGDYELLGEIARGGMGVVYRARQTGLDRVVALKMMLGGHAGPEEVQRFRQEAEAAAQLKHPNIVAIHEVGERDGQPFFSMDFIEGQTLRQLTRDNPLSAQRAAACLKTVAEAVHYAHERGVVHRDLKPSNVLMDAVGQPHVTDFGLAKRLNNPELGTQNPELTLSGAAMGTPGYMPPEQAGGQTRTVGPLADVYALGAMLYDLLTGRPPFRGETPVETMAQVMENEPVAPRLLNASVPRDLETICLKCLAKDPARRFASAQALAEDLGRYLSHEPILAQPPSALYRAQKFVRRHRVGMAVAAGFVLVLLTASGISIGYGIQATRARKREEGERIRATNAETAANRKAREALQAQTESKAVLDFVRDHILAAARPVAEKLGLGHDVTLRAAIEAAATVIPTSFTNAPLVEAEVRRTLGVTLSDLGEFAKAIDQFERAVAIVKRIQGANSRECLRLMEMLGDAYGNADRLPKAAAMMEEVVSRRMAHYGERDSGTIGSVINLAHIQFSQRNFPVAMTNYLTAIRLEEEVLGSNHIKTTALAGLANVHQRMGNYEAALDVRRRVLKVRLDTLGPTNSSTLLAQANFATTLQDMGRLDEAIAMHLENLKLKQAVFEANHPDVLVTLHNLGVAYATQKDYREALPYLTNATDLRSERLGPAHRETLHSAQELAKAWRALERPAEVVLLYSNLLRQAQAQYGEGSQPSIEAMDRLASAYGAVGDKANVVHLHERMLAASQKEFGPSDKRTLGYLEHLARWYHRTQRFAKAEVLLRRLEAEQRQWNLSDKAPLATTLAQLGAALIQQAKYPEAEGVLREAIPTFVKNQPDGSSTFAVYSQLGWSLLGQGRHQEAKGWLHKAHAGLSQETANPSPSHLHYLRETRRLLAELYEALGKREEAEKWRAPR